MLVLDRAATPRLRTGSALKSVHTSFLAGLQSTSEWSFRPEPGASTRSVQKHHDKVCIYTETQVIPVSAKEMIKGELSGHKKTPSVVDGAFIANNVRDQFKL
jgi:hypothetical protein